MSSRHRSLIFGLVAAVIQNAAYAQDPINVLIEQGQYWQSRGNGQRAAEAWQKLLRLNATQADALYGMATVELEAKRPEAARDYLAQLKRAHPGSPLVAQLEQAINLGGNPRQLEDARQLARSGESTQAIAAYQQALGGKPPQGRLALEYYQTLGGTPQGWDEARQGLERLARESPNDSQIALALAQHLTYRENTRRDGIQRLAELSSRPDVGSAATAAWRRSLAWIGTRAADVPLYQAFLQKNPDDAAIKGRLDEITKQEQETRRTVQASVDPLRQRSSEGFKALDTGDLAKAEADFQAVLSRRANDGDALGGLGVLRLRQERFSEARDLLERATRQGSAARWRTALNSASYWSLIGQATAARDSNDLGTARRLLEQAVKLDPKEITAENALADVLAQSGQLDAAEAAYRRVLARQNDNPDAVRGLVGVMAQNNKPDQALAIIERLSPAQQDQIGELGKLRAAQAVGAAKAASARGDDNTARIALEDALLNDPNSPWIRLDLARLYMKMGGLNDARGVMDGLLISNPNMPEALYASALLASEMKDWNGALTTLENIPAQNRTRDMATLQRRVWVHAQADRASELARQGSQREALAVLGQIEASAGQDPELLGAVASAYSDAGDSTRAIGMIRQLMARTTRPGAGIRLQYAAILLKTGQDVELAGVLRQLQPGQMTSSERQSFEDIRLAYIVRQADALRESGDLVTAYDTLAPVLAERPDDPQAIGALARMHAAAGDHAQALALYTELLRRSPEDLPLMLSAVGVATSAKEYGYAESTIEAALARAPQNPDVLTAAGRLYRAQGKNSKAAQYFTAAVAAENQQRGVPVAGGRGAPAQVANAGRSTNPFVGRPGQRASSAQGQQQAPSVASPGFLPTVQPGYAPQVASAQGYAPQGGNPYGGNAYIPTPAGASGYAAPSQDAYVQQGYTPYGAPSAPAAPGAYYQDAAPAAPAAAPRGAIPAPASTRTPARNTAAASAASPYGQAPVAASPYGAGSQYGQQAPQYAQAGQYPLPAYGQAQSYVPPPATPASQAPAYMAPYFAGGAARQASAYAAGQPAGPLASAPWSVDAPAAGAPPRPRTVQDELNEIRQDRTPTIAVAPTVRTRQGESGMSELSDISAPVEMKLPVGDGKFALRVTPVAIDAGTPGSSYDANSRFGGGPAAAIAQAGRTTGDAGSQSQTGLGIGVGYLGERIEADLGSSPLGFRYTTLNGGLRLKGPFAGDFSYNAEVSRRPVTDSLLSFAGARDARTGESWGGVSATGGRLEIGYDNGEYGLYGYGSFHSLDGTNVVTNSRIEGGGGIYVRMMRDANSDLTGGINITALSYDKNLRYFTYGHGGYFSPQSFLSMSVPLTWNQRSGRLAYQVRGSIGVQHFTEDAADYFPGNSGRQAGAQLAAASAVGLNLGGTGSAIYPGQSKTGLGYNLGAAVEYQLAPQLFLGGHLAMDNASDYRQFVGGMYLKYAFEPMTRQASLPVNPVRSPYHY
ncbi:tetratricopeptide repeat protein [Pigmentiphaga aceris]|uniref:Tetratricopeptide repeat protein n=1 Tax=Pigmentiphaga aceris TaxID=1940612 RepID=A0A5C0AXY1_9BURK|nr:cellulose synthase subunit BcsC-related outer membrane protein [Pigmentiphaga aceris]QEI07025.1 tetratricopeptide repeat protein [Pigmentiphaga aceris]